MKPDRSFKWRRFPPIQVFNYVLFRTLIMLVCMFSARYGRRIGRIIGKLFYLVDAKHRQIAEKNLLRAEGMPKDRREAKRFVRRCYEHIGLSLVENLMLPRLHARHELRSMVRIEGEERIRALLAEGRGVIGVIGHLGNWELGGLAVALTGLPIHVIARPVENPWIDRYLAGFRTSTGTSVIPKFGAVAAAREVLRQREILVVLADQDARKAGVFVRFFGRPASTVKTPAMLALRYRAPIVPVNIFREGRESHVVRIGDPILPADFPSIEDGMRALTAAYTSRLEEFIREHPEQWMWLHARWKTKPAGAESDEAAEAVPAARAT